VLQGLHHGLGRGCGAVIGGKKKEGENACSGHSVTIINLLSGLFVTYFGSKLTFRGYGVFCFFVLVAFVFINFYRVDQGFVSEIPTSEDPHQVRDRFSFAHLSSQ
jgi:hypothetical protein